jgi:hypothetical protein
MCTPGGAALSEIKEHMKIVGKDGVQVGTVDKIEVGCPRRIWHIVP